MARTRIKFCGITGRQDALAAAEAGADAIGIVLYPKAARYVAPEIAAGILRDLPPFMTPVGIFVDAKSEEILETSKRLGLRHVQLNGLEPPSLLAELRDRRIIKALKVEPATLRQRLSEWREAIEQMDLRNLVALVLETAATGEAGGSGVENDWAAIAEAQSAGAFAGLPPIIAAGGLTAENVGEVVRRLRPWAVDVSSGVEVSRGCKSMEQLRGFATAVGRADSDV